MPKRVFDVFVRMNPTERLYSQLHRMRRRKDVPVKGTFNTQSKKQPLSSYMIDPKYLPPDVENTERQSVATTQPRRPVYHYSRLSEPMAYETTTPEVGRESLGASATIKNYLYRLRDNIGNSALWRNTKRKSAVTYTLSEGVIRGRWARTANWATISVFSLAVLSLLTLGILNWPLTNEVSTPPSNPSPSDRNGARESAGAGVSGADDQSQVSDRTGTSVADPQTAPRSSSVEGGRGGGSGSGGTGGSGGANEDLTQPLEEVVEGLCITSYLSCLEQQGTSVLP